MPVTNYHRTRIAPTPSGFLHLGNVLSFAITATLAQQHGAKILLRIDDLDQARVNDQYLHDIFDTLDFLGIGWQEGPKDIADFKENYSQLHRLDNYNAVLEKLKNMGLVFACTCSRQQIGSGARCDCYAKKISLTTENACWRLLTDDISQPAIKTYDGKLTAVVLPAEMRNFIVRKKDGFPAYQLTSVVDDLLYGVDLVVRGEDLWVSTIAQQVLANAVGEGNIFSAITFYHHPLLMEKPGKKLSKSAGDTSIHQLRKAGAKPADIFKLISTMAGLPVPATNREQLGAAIINPGLST